MVVATLAAAHQGVPVDRLQLNDGGVWVTNEQLHLAGHLNYPSRTIDGGVAALSTSFDVSQHANDVLLHDSPAGKSTVQSIATSTLALGQAFTVPAGMQVVQGDDTAAVVDPGSGKVWVVAASALSTFSTRSTPVIHGAKDVAAIVGSDGAVDAVDATGQVTRVTGHDGAWHAQQVGKLAGVTSTAHLELTVVGDQLVALDTSTGVVHTLRGRVSLSSGSAGALAIQQPGPSSDEVLVASATQLIHVPLSGASPTRVPAGTAQGEGVPVAPVILDGCSYAAWAGTGNYRRDCSDTSDSQQLVSAAVAKTSTPVFRTNRDVVVLNDTTNGNVYLVNEHMQAVNNWADVQSQIKDAKHNKQTADSTQVEKTTKTSSKKQPPQPQNDQFGVRPGRTTVLPVLMNDSDPSGLVLTAEVKPSDAKTSLGPVQQVRGGQALQITTPSDARGTTTFTYYADDGETAPVPAKVTLTVKGPQDESAPEQLIAPAALTMQQGAHLSYNALQGWVDPEGDQFYLQSATSEKPDLRIGAQVNGTVTIKALPNAAVGPHTISVTMSDGRKSRTSGKLVVDVTKGASAPVANPDFASGAVGSPLVIKPLANDYDPLGGTLTLASIGKTSTGATASADYAAGTITYTPSKQGTQYLSYSVANAHGTATSKIRIDAKTIRGAVAPLAEPDLGALPAGGSVTIPVLDNDDDPAGGVLVVTDVQVGANSPVTAEVINHESIRVTAPGGLTAPTIFHYVVSDGQGTATGQVTVVPRPVDSSVPPVAVDDTGTVRAGDVTSVDVLDNDYSPSGLDLTVSPKLQIVGKPLIGSTAFVSQDQVRLKAGSAAGTERVTYTVTDADGNPASADVVFTVVPLAQKNRPPAPPALTARAIAGTTTTIQVPVTGVDPDGDSVMVTAVTGSARLGTPQVVGNTITYAAASGAAGTDSFTYVVADRFGAQGVGTVRVGVAPPPASGTPPVAVPDQARVRPSRLLGVAVLSNDFSPDGYPLSLVPSMLKPADAASGRTPVRVQGSQLVLTTPATDQVLRYFYGISDGHGGTAQGLLTIKVDKHAPLLAPIAQDDYVAPTEVAGKKTVDVKVLSNDADPDGLTSDLKVTTSAPGVQVLSGGVLRVPVQAQRQVILYTDTDVDGLTGDAVVVVPGSTDQPPTLIPGVLPAQAVAGKVLDIQLSKYVSVRPGHSPHVFYAKTVVAGPSATAQLTSPNTVAFTSKAGSFGMTWVQFQVSDGTSRTDKSALSATLTLPVHVKATSALPLIFRPTTTQVVAGKSTRIDLAPMVQDPNPGSHPSLHFGVGTVPGGYRATISGSTLSVAAPLNAVGASASIPLTVSDGSTKPVGGSLPVHVAGSDAPLITTTTATLDNVKKGSTAHVDITQYATNPFPGKPLRLVGQPQHSGAAGTVTAQGTTVDVTPSTNGQMTITYRVGDATDQANRVVAGTIVVTAIATPAAPVGVSAETHVSRTASVSWTPGNANGSPITGFTVHWAGGSQACGLVTTCTITGLTNSTTYTFTVTAANAVGTSPASAPSAPITPDVKPNPPSEPTVSGPEGDKSDRHLTVSWTPASTEGSPVSQYTIRNINTGQSKTVPASVSSVDFTGLTNGTRYSFTVVATNKKGDSDPSAPGSGVPMGLPAAPTGLQGDFSPAAAGTAPSVSLSWQAADPNGDQPQNVRYTVSSPSGAIPNCAGIAVLQCSAPSPAKGNVTFTVTATNAAGVGTAASTTLQVFSAPGPVQGLQIVPTGASNTVKISFSPGDLNGATQSQESYAWSAGGASGNLPLGGGVITNAAFQNGSAATVQVTATTSDGIHRATSDTASASSPYQVYGAPTTPSISCSGGSQSVTCNWSGGSDGGSPTSYSFSNGGSGAASASGSQTFGGFGYSQTVTICITATQSATAYTGARSGGANCSSATTAGWPQVSNSGSSGACYTAAARKYGLPCWTFTVTGVPNEPISCSVTSTINGAKNWGWVGNLDGSGRQVIHYGNGQYNGYEVFGSMTPSDIAGICQANG
ncbi:Ig-like domain-containing protein [Flexivirga caeni]|uniref:Fibronectin type-III domain-containing protein n=1 Tax=Flexivirga caeni TaxID=2294115 RepID=A0A3M9M9V4_9MICO|nr:Ig-like domain-containing protein [Flexivirga caeni]RNI22286.1 hypothetical protein EFY87_09960 [Flexivirga caeni]